MAKKVVIVGAGAGGGLTASRLRKLIPKEELEITVIDRDGTTDFQPSYTMISTGNRSPDQISTPIEHFTKIGIKPIKAEVKEIDPKNRYVITGEEKIGYDVLVLSPGVKFDYGKFPGSDKLFHFWDMHSALKLRQQLAGFNGGRILISVTTKLYKCPPVPWEMAMMLDHYFRMKGIRDKVEITVAHWAPKPFAMFGPTLSEPATRWIEERGIKTINNFTLRSIQADKNEITSETGESVKFDLGIVAPPHLPHDFISNNDDLRSENGWLSSNIDNFRTSKFDDIYGLGDAIAPTVGLGMAGVFAHFQADTVATLIAGDITGSYSAVPYNSLGLCAADLGHAGWIAYCDFGGKLRNQSPFPDCRSTGKSVLFKLAHPIYERYFLANVYGGWY